MSSTDFDSYERAPTCFGSCGGQPGRFSQRLCFLFFFPLTFDTGYWVRMMSSHGIGAWMYKQILDDHGISSIHVVFSSRELSFLVGMIYGFTLQRWGLRLFVFGISGIVRPRNTEGQNQKANLCTRMVIQVEIHQGLLCPTYDCTLRTPLDPIELVSHLVHIFEISSHPLNPSLDLSIQGNNNTRISTPHKVLVRST